MGTAAIRSVPVRDPCPPSRSGRYAVRDAVTGPGRTRARPAAALASAPQPEEHALGHYRFVTHLRLAADRPAVREAVLDPRPWAGTMGDVVHLERTAVGDERGVGRAFRAAVRAPLGYTLGADLVVEEATEGRIRLRATGDLVGTGVWDLIGEPGITDATFTWDVETRVRWMDLLEPVARPLFVHSHRAVMRHACRAAADHLGAELLAFSSTEDG